MAYTDNLIAYWPCDEASGDLIDAHGSNDLTDVNTVGATTGKVSGGRDFEAADDERFTSSDSASFSTGDIDFTIQAWVKLESKAQGGGIVAKWLTGENEYILFYSELGDRFAFGVSPDGSAATVVSANNLGSPSTGVWYLVHAWHDATANEIGIAINAGTPDTAAHSTGVRDGTAELWIGGNPDAPGLNELDGVLDEIAFWKRLLTSEERTSLYNGGAGRSYSDITNPFGRRYLRGGMHTLSGGLA